MRLLVKFVAGACSSFDVFIEAWPPEMLTCQGFHSFDSRMSFVQCAKNSSSERRRIEETYSAQ